MVLFLHQIVKNFVLTSEKLCDKALLKHKSFFLITKSKIKT